MPAFAPRRRLWPYLALVIALYLHCVAGLRVTEAHLKAARFVTPFDNFGFGPRGSLQITAAIDPDTNATLIDEDKITIFICPQKQYSILVTDSNSLTKICGDELSPKVPTTTDCQVAPLNGGNVTELFFTVADVYRFSVVNCMRLSSNHPYAWLNMSYVALNDDATSELPANSAPYPKIYLALLIAWVVAVGGWISMIIRMRTFQNTIHNFLSVVIGLKVAVTVIAWYYWSRYECCGIRIDELAYLRSFVFAVSETALFCALLLVAKGWLIDRPSLAASEIRTVSLALLLLLATLLFFSFNSDDYYFLVMLIMYFFLLPKIFSSVTRNLKSLMAQLWVIDRSTIETNPAYREAIRQKVELYKLLRATIALYLCAIILVNIMRLLMGWSIEWLSFTVNEVATLGMVCGVCWALRPNDTGAFMMVPELPAITQLQALLSIDPNAANAGNNAQNERTEPWDMTTTFIVEYPHEGWVKNLSGDMKFNSGRTIGSLKRRTASSLAIPMAVCVEEKYDRKNTTGGGVE